MTKSRPTLGVVVNPVAGMGGAVGLKGTDGPETVARARRLGAMPWSPNRARAALESLKCSDLMATIVTCPGLMGELELQSCGVQPNILDGLSAADTTAADTEAGAKAMVACGVDLILFVGGDGTARDILRAVGQDVPVVGVPAGVKIHSGVFAISPRAAGAIASDFLRGQIRHVSDAEVMDIDEDAFRRGEVSARLFGYLKTPIQKGLMQGPKAQSRPEAWARRDIAKAVAAMMRAEPRTVFVLGPGSTTYAVLEELGLSGSLLGVDVIRDGELLASDANEQQLLKLVGNQRARIIVSPIGGQGHILGRGNQQISSQLVRRVGGNGFVVISTPEKIATLNGRPLLVDTDDLELNRSFNGHIRVIAGMARQIVYPIKGV